jgi:hypothetical protein
MRPLFVLQEQKESFAKPVVTSAIGQFVFRRSMTGRDRDEAAIAGKIDQYFYPHRHEAPSSDNNAAQPQSILRRATITPALSHG